MVPPLRDEVREAMAHAGRAEDSFVLFPREVGNSSVIEKRAAEGVAVFEGDQWRGRLLRWEGVSCLGRIECAFKIYMVKHA
jgi:hypothetical protein